VRVGWSGSSLLQGPLITYSTFVHVPHLSRRLDSRCSIKGVLDFMLLLRWKCGQNKPRLRNVLNTEDLVIWDALVLTCPANLFVAIPTAEDSTGRAIPLLLIDRRLHRGGRPAYRLKLLLCHLPRIRIASRHCVTNQPVHMYTQLGGI